jgi:hypothetical protein
MPRIDVRWNEESLNEKWHVLGRDNVELCLKDQQLLQCVHMKFCDNEENNYY